jgi:hypothetical protein
MESISKFENLDTSYVSLAALVNHLRAQQFTGRLHVTLDQYEADVFLRGSSAPEVREKDHLSGRESGGEGAFERLMVRAREPGGSIELFETTESSSAEAASTPSLSSISIPDQPVEVSHGSADPDGLIVPTGELIAAVERAVESTGINFDNVFNAARIELGDDYPFMDPTSGAFAYAKGVVTMPSGPSKTAFVNAVSEALRRVINRLGNDQSGSARQRARFRERVAVEMAIAMRRDPSGLSDFSSKLDHIAGTRVL